MAVTWGAVLLATLALPISAGSAQEQKQAHTIRTDAPHDAAL